MSTTFLPPKLTRIVSAHPILLASSAAGLLIIGIPVYKLLSLRHYLSTHIHSFHSTGPDAIRSTAHAHIPDLIIEQSENYRIASDVATKSVPRKRLPKARSYDELLTIYLRHTMAAFGRLPQAYILRLMAPPANRSSFDAEHLRNLNFQPNDLANGGYTVLSRELPGVCVFGMSLTGLEAVDGRLVVSIGDMSESKVESEGLEERVLFKTETFMWTPKEKKTVIPLERGLGRWAHETTSWWLIESGTTYLASLVDS